MDRINVTKTFLPPLEEYHEYLDKIWQRAQLTNQGPLLKEFEDELQKRFKLRNLHFVANGTLALQVALRSLGSEGGEVITTPFSYVATTSSILWERFKPVFVDIDPKTLCLDATKLEAAITGHTKAIMPVHVFGNPCDVETIEKIAKKHNLPVIYDAAHAFGVEYKGRSLLDYGDLSMCSLHSTKLFHSIEGGLLIAKEDTTHAMIELAKRFGHNGDDHYRLGTNAKASEFQAAMGLCNLRYIDKIIESRKKISKLYDKLLRGKIERPVLRKGTKYNYAYYPVIFKSEKDLLKKQAELNKENIHPRRYFHPSLNKLPYIEDAQECPVSEDISKRIMCLPLYHGLGAKAVNKIGGIVAA